jgi:5-methylthioadenosine/S-adenosylhomocysteine deaminase
MGIILQNGLIITQNSNRDIFKADILINNGIIKDIQQKLPVNNHQLYDLQGLVISPGFIQSHIHLCQTLFRNLADDLELLNWLEDRIWPLEMAHSEDSLRASAQLGLAELFLGGTSTILDMGNGSFQNIIFEEMKKSGIRGFSGMVMMDYGEQSYKQDTKKALISVEKLINKWHQSSSGRINYALAPRFVPSCSTELWKGVKALSNDYNLIIHTHSSENKKEWEMVKSLTGYSNVEYFVKNKLASNKLCLAHCIWVSEEEIKMMAESGINVLHCPSANLKLGSGIAPVPKFLDNQINVSLGSDGAPCNNNLDIIMEMRLASLIQKPLAGVTSTSAKQIFDMATIGGATSLGMKDKIGSIEIGKKADFTVLNLNQVHSIPSDDIYSQIVYSTSKSNVLHLMIDGKWIVFNQQLQTLSEEIIKKNTWDQIKLLLKSL